MTVLYTTPGLRGIGDALFLTAVAHQLKRRNKLSAVVVRNKNFELFFNSPDVDVVICGYEDANRSLRLLPRETKLLPQLVGLRWSLTWLTMTSGLFGKSINAHHGWPPQKRLLEEVAENCSLHLNSDQKRHLRPYYWPYQDELQAQRDFRGAICVHSNAATYWTPNKQWPVERIQRVVDELANTHLVVQLGASQDVPLRGAMDMRGKTTLRQSAAILANASILIGMEGGLMHLARAVDTRSVIVFTGFITPEYTGYDVNYNLFGLVERTDLPCWSREKCICDCAERVSVEQVLQGIEWCLAQPPLQKHFLNRTDDPAKI